ncbi:MAG: cation:proton antiporter, partial [Alcaligenaceae bacterium]
PYAVLLAIVGCAIGLSGQYHGWVPPVLGEFLSLFNHIEISSDTFLIVFLPVLLFETALAMNVRRLIDDLGPILLLAIVAVFVSTACVGVVLAQFSGFSLVTCLILGAIVATTDPAAVVGIFKEVGAPTRLSTLVEGESLLNDAAAIAVYTFLLALLSKSGEGASHLLLPAFLKVFLGGAVTGFLLGRLTCLAFVWLRGWPVAEISLTLSLAYFAYFVAEHYLHVSGVVSTVVAGLVVGSTGRTRMAPLTFENLSHSWHQFGFWANSLIFLLAAMLVPKMTAHATWINVFYVALVFCATLFARAVVVFGLLPMMSWLRIATRVNPSFRVVIWWGGLRGAVSLALALAVTEHNNLPEDASRFIAISATGFVLATLFLNGLTLQPLIKLLGLNALTAKERALSNQAVIVTTALIQQETDQIAKSEAVPERAHSRVHQVFDQALLQASETQLVNFSESEKFELGLLILARREFERYFNVLKHDIIDRRLAEKLLGRAERLEDLVRASGLEGFRAAVARAVRYPRRFRQALRVYERFGVQRWLAYELSQRFITLMSMRSIAQQLLEFAETKLPDLIGGNATAQVVRAHRERHEFVREALHALELQYPTYSLWLHERYLGRIARGLEREKYAEMLEQSLVSGEVYADLLEKADERWAFLEQEQPLDIEMSAQALVARVPLLSDLPAQALSEVTKMLTPRLFLPNQLISGEQLPPFGLYIVASGAVLVLLPDGTHAELGSGEFFGELALLSNEKIEGFEVRSLGYSKVLCLPAKSFNDLLAHNAGLKEKIELVAKQRLRAIEVWRDHQSK